MKMPLKKIKIMILMLLLCVSIAYGANSDVTEQIQRFENSIWGFNYTKDDASKRLSRIENNVFGQTNANLSIDDRIKKINEALGFESIQDSKKQAWELDKTEIAGINYPQIDTLEYQLFKGTYEKENIYKRLERLEQKIFGSTQEGDLASRTERLKAYIRKDEIARNPNQYIEKRYSTTPDVEQYMGSQNKYENSDVYIQLAGLETILFSKTYSQDPVGLRLNRLERKIFQRDFSSDDEFLRIQRLQAAAQAQKTAKLYEANKIQKYASTGIQLGSIILMILALIL